jgi:hypothetical protein
MEKRQPKHGGKEQWFMLGTMISGTKHIANSLLKLALMWSKNDNSSKARSTFLQQGPVSHC